jgi:hypothetical protein
VAAADAVGVAGAESLPPAVSEFASAVHAASAATLQTAINARFIAVLQKPLIAAVELE